MNDLTNGAVVDDHAVPQTQHHAYSSDGKYHGVVIATPTQLADLGLTAGNPPPPDMTALKSAASQRVIDEHATMLEKLSGNYTAAERDTWTLQLEWARGYLDDQNAVARAFLSGMVPADQATTPVDDAQMMADRIVAKANQYAALTMLAQRTKAEALAAVAAAATPADLDAVMAGLAGVVTAAIAELNSMV
jgi:hypothetical protein